MVSFCSFTRAIALFSCIIVLSSAPVLAATSSYSCANAVEKGALDMRVLQTELMVAALSCNERAEYGRFVKKFQPQLQQQGKTLKAYFARVYKGKGDYQLNRFVTQIANGVSQRHAHTKPSTFCAAAKSLFAETLQQDDRSLVMVSTQERFSVQHGIEQCGQAKNTQSVKLVKN